MSRIEAHNDESKTFKKAFQEVGRPATTDHNINDEYMRDPPNNTGDAPTTDRKTRGAKEGAYGIEPTQEGVLGDPGKGRPKKDELMREAIQGAGDENELLTSS
ncbi:hypothetical protein GLOTRDRAFT_43526 [Gloeophyllum trabeum ATCC 11539]|uniref:Uncharacterized protein n=1 Tax=Gloeophyllum trabeum (strain ATCC 11539 / FP-39264 / Madison 617) TaxID=670483 RepID=S7Q504_GLOTA|nr:uncharacterized protein GLOTRDRAFT_43526 [Gloeophyllum trabeum ATCC 11539]EPQ54592.1 hypothetical protein GLOTRDRAFT_43526 [Gloeophyllum trabeum ATCC 11539]